MLGTLKCKLGLHVGYPERLGANGPMTVYCTRCESHTNPIDADTTDRITEEFLREEGYDELADKRYGSD